MRANMKCRLMQWEENEMPVDAVGGKSPAAKTFAYRNCQ